MHARQFGAFGLRWGSGLSCGKEGLSPWCDFLLPREVGTLQYSQFKSPGELLRDVSQSLNRATTSHRERTVKGCFRHVAMTCMPKAIPWLDQGATSRILLGRESLLLQGFPITRVERIDAFSEAFLQDLAGNAMALPVVLAVLMASFCAVNWKETSAEAAPAASDADVGAAWAALTKLVPDLGS